MSWLSRTPSISTRSFKRAAGRLSASSRHAMDMERIRIIIASERKQAQQNSPQDKGPLDGIGHYTLAVDPYFKLPQTVGLHTVGGIDIGGANHAANGDGLVFGIDLDIFGCFHYQSAVGQDVCH